MTQQKRNTWFEETFLPSQEARMTNPKYPYQVILSERQAMVCEKYMKPTTPDCIVYKYEFGTKHFWMHRAGRYTFLGLEDDSKKFWYIKLKNSEEYLKTFETEREMQDWIDENVDDETGDIKGMDHAWWYSGMDYRK